MAIASRAFITNSCLPKAPQKVDFIALKYVSINARVLGGDEPVLQYNFVSTVVYIRIIKLSLIV